MTDQGSNIMVVLSDNDKTMERGQESSIMTPDRWGGVVFRHAYKHTHTHTHTGGEVTFHTFLIWEIAGWTYTHTQVGRERNRERE